MDSTTRALQRGSKGLVIGARDGTVSEDAVLGVFLPIYPLCELDNLI